MLLKEPVPLNTVHPSPVHSLLAAPASVKQEVRQEVSPAAPACEAVSLKEKMVTVTHGIHHKDFPVSGMTVAQIRRTLFSILNIDPGSVAVIDGHVIKDEDSRIVIGKDHLVSFVKESSIRGSSSHGS